MFTHTFRRIAPVMLVLLLTGGAAMAAKQEGLKLYVAPNGNDAWSGKRAAPRGQDGPFATLERARDEIRKLKAAGLPTGGVTVELAPGIYERAQPFELSAEDSGTEAAPITYRAAKTGQTRLSGGKVLGGWQPVRDPAVLARLEAPARGKVLQSDLRAQGITDYGPPSGGGLELFFQDEPMLLSRWPNEGFVRVVDVQGDQPVDVRGTKGDRSGIFVYEGDRPTRWQSEKDPWVHGYWFWDWSDGRQKIASIDTEKRVITLAPPTHSYGYRKGQWYYAFNLLSEIDQPGEWYLDRETGILYFWPPAPIEKGSPMVSVAPSLVTLSECSHVTLQGFRLEACRGTAITITGGTQSRVAACTLLNLGGSAVRVAGGTRHTVAGCDIYEVGDGGISLDGGDRKTLTPAGHVAENNHVHHYGRIHRMYQTAVSLGGVGNVARHNLIDNAPHMAIFFSGNDHLIELNEIHSVCHESNDAGAIYAGRDWTMRGTVIRHNYLHNINGFQGRGCVGVYLDDMFCGVTITGNVFYRVTNAAFIGGGRDNIVENNIFVECSPAVHVDARAQGWAGGSVPTTMKTRLDAMPYKEALWSGRYPALVNVWEDEPAAPKGNVVARNVWTGGRWDGVEAKARPLITFTDNLLEGDPGFVDAARLDFRLQKDSPAWKLGFKPIPIEQIGLRKDAPRASWPVRSEVRRVPAPPPPAPRVKRAAPAVFRVPRAAAAVTVDGSLAAGEWLGLDPDRAMVVEQGIEGEKVAPRSLAWLWHDGESLFLGVENAMDAAKPMAIGNTWGQNEAVEIALRNPAGGKTAPILVLRGYASGHQESSAEAGASPAAVRRAGEGVTYQARVDGPSRWTAEWRIPLASLGLDVKAGRIPFNLSVRKVVPNLWVMWQGTGAHTWDVDTAGFIELAP